MLDKFLRSRGFQVVQASNGPEALEILSDQTIDIVLTDIYMPALSGKELITVIHEQRPDLPIIAMTGHPNVEDAVDLMRHGVKDYMTKPIELARLEAVIHHTLDQLYEQATPSWDPFSGEQPEQVAGYRILSTLGKGSMGLVYLVYRPGKEDEKLALKILDPGPVTQNPKLKERFLREAAVAKQVRHPSIVRLYEFGIATEHEILYMVMEYVQGETLSQIIESKRPLNYATKLKIIRQVAQALEAIHQQDLCHRDIKPGNVMVDENGRAKLTDFGLVRVPNSDLTGAYRVVGTPAYLAPESYIHATVDHRVDLFALGVMAYELFFGERPFDSVIFATLVDQIENQLPRAPRKIDPAFPLSLQNILANLLKKDPEERYQSAAEVISDIDLYLQGRQEQTFSGLREQWHALRSRDWS